MERSKKMIVLSHCIINANSKVEGLSLYPAFIKEFIYDLMEQNIGIIQLPCPEMDIYGIKRFGHVKEQFDHLHFRKRCRTLLEPIINQIENYKKNGYKIIGVVGIEGSPSCGVNMTCSGSRKGENCLVVKRINEEGVFMEELKAMLQEEDIPLPFIGIDEKNMQESMDKLREFVRDE